MCIDDVKKIIDGKVVSECPICHQKMCFRRNGAGRYFCSECCIEVQVLKGYVRIYAPTRDGHAVLLNKIRVG